MYLVRLTKQGWVSYATRLGRRGRRGVDVDDRASEMGHVQPPPLDVLVRRLGHRRTASLDDTTRWLNDLPTVPGEQALTSPHITTAGSS